MSIALEMFAPGRDAGVDLRAMHTKDGTLIVQCKRYATDAYDQLIHQLKEKELPKVNRLGPGRYLVVTSVGLSPARKTAIREAMSPWIQSDDDVLGREDLDGLLARHPNVERRHIKLWLTSTEVLTRSI